MPKKKTSVRPKRVASSPSPKPRATSKSKSTSKSTSNSSAKRAAVKRAAASPTSVRTSDDVATFLRTWTHPLKRELELVRHLILDAGPSIREGIKWNSLSFRTTDDFATLNGPRHTERVMVILHTGAKAKGVQMRGQIDDPAELLAWRGADRALVTFEDARDLRTRSAAFQAIVRSWTRALAAST
jgi:hypothetical protein